MLLSVTANGNTLQMKVEAILLAEGINDVLLAHLIPANYITQDAVIGQGHFGQVHKGKLIIPEIGVNKVVAIKGLKGRKPSIKINVKN